MPTLEYLEAHSKFGEYPANLTYGFQDEIFKPFDQVMHDIILGDDDLDPEGADKITSRLLRTGPCPSTSRVYYQLTASPRYPSRNETITEFLGEEFDEGIERRALGNMFEEWIDRANKALNEWLQTQSREPLNDADIPDSIREFYLDRLDSIRELATDLDISVSKLVMSVNDEFSEQYFHPVAPDGVWLLENVNGTPGGVFESKLSKLPESVDKHVLTGYAVYIEKSHNLPMDYGVYLYTDEDERELRLDSFYINDNFRTEIRDNLTRFATLVQKSKESGQWEEGGPIPDRLIEPPEPDYVSYCDECLYSEVCHGE